MKTRRILENIYIGLVMVFLYAPILVLVVLSFNASKSRAKWGGFTLKWYGELFQNREIMSALSNTLLIALLSALFATVIGTLAVIAMSRMKKVPKTILTTLSNIPMLNAEIVTGVSLMLVFVAVNMKLGFNAVLIGHITFNIPYVVLSVLPKMKQTNSSVYEAALDLGATPVKAFCKVVLPDLMPGIVSGFILSFTMSMDDFVITHFTRGAEIHTLSTKIYAETRKGIKPEMYALSTLLFVSVLVLLIIVNKRNMAEAKKRKN